MRTKEKPTVKAIYATLQIALTDIKSNEQWLNLLKFQAKFHTYSFNNQLHIYFQMPTATYVAGFTAWNAMGRTIKKGSKAIRVLAPCRYKAELQEDSEPQYIIRGFKWVNVFDISQTEGDGASIPLVVRGLSDNADCTDIFQRLLAVIDIPVSMSDSIRYKGYYDPKSQSIVLSSDISITQQLKTLIHEYAHHLHLTKHNDDEDRNICEVIAESAAFVVSNYLGIDTQDYSIPYIKSWAENTDVLCLVGEKVQRIANQIIYKITNAEEEN